ncbi:MAG TPA: hypothetical protein VHW23_34290, partial [Kofleriaceae bacterium]|nr:hypothetical protein [Kofleriaceae bacterium]
MKRRGALHMAMAVVGGLVLAASVALVVALHAASQHVWATVLLVAIAVAVVIYRVPRLYAWRYVLPGALAVVVFVVVPIVYSFGISFTNYGSTHLLSFERATAVLLARSNASDLGLDVELRAAGDRTRFAFTNDDGARFVSDPVQLGPPLRVSLRAADPAAEQPGEPLTLKQLVAL